MRALAVIPHLNGVRIQEKICLQRRGMAPHLEDKHLARCQKEKTKNDVVVGSSPLVLGRKVTRQHT